MWTSPSSVGQLAKDDHILSSGFIISKEPLLGCLGGITEMPTMVPDF